MRPLGLAALTVLELPPAEQVSVAAEVGYTHVGLRLIPVPGQPFVHAFRLNEVRKRLEETGIRVLDVEVFRLAPETRVLDFEPVLAQAAMLGATDLLVHGADSTSSRLVENFGELCDLARRYGLAANLEPMPWVAVSNLAQALSVLHAAGRDNSGVLVDAIHFFRARDSFEALAKVPRRFLRYVQLCDARAEIPADMDEIIRQARGDRRFPGEGGLDLAGLLAALPADLPVSLEIPVAAALPAQERARRAVAATRRLLT